MQHQIQIQQFLLTIRPGVDVFPLEHAASGFLRQGLLPALERIFDELCGEEVVIRLDHCYIDLGIIGEAVLRDVIVDDALYRLLKAEVCRVIEKELVLRPGASVRRGENELERWWYYMEHGRLPWNATALDEEAQRRVLEMFSADFEQITRLRKALKAGSIFLTRVAAQHSEWFLENLVAVLAASRQGGLREAVIQAVTAHRLLERIYGHWVSDVSPGQAPEGAGYGEGLQQAGELQHWEELRHREVRGEVRDGLSRWAKRMADLRQAAGHDKKAILWRRLLMLAAERQTEFVRGGGIQLLLGDIPDSPPLAAILAANQEFRDGQGPFLQGLRGMAEGRQRGVVSREKNAEEVSGSDVVTGRPVDEAGVSSSETGEEAGRGKARTTGEVEERQSDKERQEKYEGSSAGNHTEQDNGGMGRVGGKAGGGEAEAGSGQEEPISAARGLPGEQVAPEGLLPEGKQPLPVDVGFKREEVTEEGTYFPNAGLILVHPFLSTFFHRVGIWNGAGFASLPARQKAIFLLHFLATGERKAPEYELVFPKLLCGYALEMPVPGEMELTEEECSEAVVLLENVVLRWERLGNTTVDGLREGFLRRQGKLADKGGRLVLQVESSGIDVLLDHLPWNFNLVKLPWLKDLLYVEWR